MITGAVPVSTIEGFRKLLKDCGPDTNKHDQVTVLIAACIDAGIDTEGSIITVARDLKFLAGHTASMLRDGIGVHWRRDREKRYSNI